MSSNATNIPKPEGSTWTDAQWEAISVRGRDTLVAAAAGSGKTAVLVERIIRRISDETDPVDVDRLLVATFTNAAAAEMRHRIREALEAALAERPDSKHLRKQLALINRAAITTLHSFCLDVITAHGQRIALDPQFRIANEIEAQLLRLDVLDELMEEWHAGVGCAEADASEGEKGRGGRSAAGEVDAAAGGREASAGDRRAFGDGDAAAEAAAAVAGEAEGAAGAAVVTEAGATDGGDPERFRRLDDRFGGDRDDRSLARLIERLYEFSRSHPWPDAWLDEMAGRFDASGGGGVWRETLLRSVRLELDGAVAALERALALAESPGGPEPYAETLRDDLAAVGRLRNAASAGWDEAYEEFRSLSFGKLKPCRGDRTDKETQERVKALREEARKRVAALQEELFGRPPDAFDAELRELAPLMRTLVSLVRRFAERYRQAKAERGLVDFADLEHYCLAILRHPDSTPEREIPSDVALEFRERFAEVLIDEYQDTNQVQEAIVRLVSRDSPGNRFMVGDVKQSIYRFRLAEPELFLAKYESYAAAGQAGMRSEVGTGSGPESDSRSGTEAVPLTGPEDRTEKQAMSSSGPAGGSETQAVPRIGPADRTETGLRIDLARNFRSRTEVVDAVNFLFRQLMRKSAAEIEYDRSAELVHGAVYYPASTDDLSAELLLIDRSAEAEEAEGLADAGTDGGDAGTEEEAELVETVRLEARAIAGQIRQLVHGPKPFAVYDKKAGGMRPATYRDIVILLRSPQAWAPHLIEELAQYGIPAYAELSTGYFAATEVELMLSLLAVIDNPLQDIPFAAVLRSPIVGLTAGQLARIRLHDRQAPFYEAAVRFASTNTDEPWADALRRGLGRLEQWRKEARRGALSELIWSILTETGYYNFCGGLPGGPQRQANLRALYDRAKQYEATSFRGLFRFLRFIDRLRESGGDLGAARALGEQEDVVRIMSIHKSKGLEFPVVFLAGLGRPFNRRDETTDFLLHKRLGFGPMYVDPDARTSRPTLPYLAIRRAIRHETLAEELRVLYVALTRPKEKLFLIGTVRGLEKRIAEWGRALEADDWPLPAHEVAGAACYLDWIGRALIRHPDAKPLRAFACLPERIPFALHRDPSRWHVQIAPQTLFLQQAAAARSLLPDADRWQAILESRPVSKPVSAWRDELDRRFSWNYPYAAVTGIRSKTSVTELKRLAERERLRDDGEGTGPFVHETAFGGLFGSGAGSSGGSVGPGGSNGSFGSFHGSSGGSVGPGGAFRTTLARRPRFMEERKLTPAERGTVYHAVMQHLPLVGPVDERVVRETVARMLDLQLLTEEQAKEVEPGPIVRFFAHEIGRRLLSAKRVMREVPFSFGLKADELAPDAATAGETVLVQGVIDCMFETEGALVILDYKTDVVVGDVDRAVARLTERYRPQLDMYARAVEVILRRPVAEKVLYFFDGGGHLVRW